MERMPLVFTKYSRKMYGEKARKRMWVNYFNLERKSYT
jgi:hypothetical protein